MAYGKDIILSTCESENIKHLNILDLADLKNRVELIHKLKIGNNFWNLINIITRYAKLANKGNLEKNIYALREYLDVELFEKESEINVYKFLQLSEKLINNKNWEYTQLINLFEENMQYLIDIFDTNVGVMIMCEDLKIRKNRLNLLALVRNYSLLIADFTLLNS